MKRWGDAHMEFLTVLPDIRELVKTSPSKQRLYAALRKAKKISMSYSYFCRLLMRHSFSAFPLEQVRNKERAATQERMTGQVGKASARPTGTAVKPATAPAPGEKKGLLVVGRRDERTAPAEEVKEEEWL
ncbi:hypothetical protein [uncultured Desulfovibrio sp.]|uniref:hypothetical protein n=1 Tax=uncultured Desulfovibrio sp. TaxID=167968 RepID=UPI00262F3694|nr:hypothetical protein [uncultured Desulfovibrio sp.]